MKAWATPQMLQNLRHNKPDAIASQSTILVTARNQLGAAEPESAGRRANYSTSGRPSEKPGGHLAVEMRAPSRPALRRARPGRYKSPPRREAKRTARLIIAITLQAGPWLPLACQTSPKRNRGVPVGGYCS